MMKLYGTYPSHFTRKVRIVLQELSLPFTFDVLTGLKEIGSQHFANNPLHRFPVLEDGSMKLWESDLICSYLSQKYSPQKDRYDPLRRSIDEMQLLAIINGAMAAGVQWIRAVRSEIPTPENFMMFRQEKQALIDSLAWLENRIAAHHLHLEQGPQSTIVEITLMSLLEWGVFRELIPSLATYPRLEKFVVERKDHPSFQTTHPSRTE